MIRVRETEALITEYEFRQMYPNVSFPQVIPLEDLDRFGCDVVFEGPQAQPNQFQIAFQDGVELIDNKWYTKYSVVDMDDDQKQAVTLQRIESNKQYRDKLLQESDWIVTKSLELGQAVPQEWLTYRQALRDIPEQEDQFNITWPVKPE